MATETATKLDELLDALAEYAGEDKNKAREVALKLIDRESTRSIADVVLKKGRTQRTEDAANKASELATQLKEAKDEIAEKAQQIRDLESKEPNWQRRLEENDKKWQAKLDAEAQKSATERRTRVADKVEIERQKFRQALRLGQEGGVDEDYGILLPAQYADRFVPDEENGSVKVLELGEKNSFYDPSEGDPAEQLARDVIAKLPPKARIAGNPEPGGGTQGAGGAVDKATKQIVENKARTENYTL